VKSASKKKYKTYKYFNILNQYSVNINSLYHTLKTHLWVCSEIWIFYKIGPRFFTAFGMKIKHKILQIVVYSNLIFGLEIQIHTNSLLGTTINYIILFWKIFDPLSLKQTCASPLPYLHWVIYKQPLWQPKSFQIKVFTLKTLNLL
jgi:hypothetical protein